KQMQGKGLLKFFLGIMAIVCVLQVLYYLPTTKVEKDAVEYANSRASKVSAESKDLEYRRARGEYLDSMSTEEIFSIPGISKFTYNDLKKRQLNLGLDLKGGMSALLEVDLTDMLRSLAGRNAKDVEFDKAIANAKAAQKTTQSNFIALFVREYEKLAPNKKLANIFSQNKSLGELNMDTPNNVVEARLREAADQTVDQTFKRLRERIDKLGVVQPNITLDKARDLILVEMPGIDNPVRARNFLQASAELQFWETYRNSDLGIIEGLRAADKRLMGDTTQVIANDTSSLQKNGPLLSALSISSANTPVSRNVVGIAEKNKRKAISEMLARPEIAALFPQDLRFLWSNKPYVDPSSNTSGTKYELYAIKTIVGSNDAPVEGDVVTDAGTTLNSNTGQPEVTLAMNSEGAKKWALLTEKVYRNNQREIAIVIDSTVVSTPSVNNGAITGGISSISGSFSTQEALDLANILEVGKLPAKPITIQESNVGPSLGAENINKSMLSLIFGFIAVMLFMMVYYAGGGVVAVIALLANLIFLVVSLASFGTVLTLPGIAGIVLTIGMAVDANVVIYERIKEELRIGKSSYEAFKEGFQLALPSIIDANITTFIVGVVLAYFGLGPIKGFAVVLMIGIITSMITAVFISKLLIEKYTQGGKRDLSFWIEPTKNVFANMNVDWVGKRKGAYIFSSVIIIAGLISIFTRGFDLGVDFSGGHSYNLKFSGEKVEAEAIRQSLEKAFGAPPIVKVIDTENTFNVTTGYLINDTGIETQEKVSDKLYEGVKGFVGSTTLDEFKKGTGMGSKILSYNKVGPTVADDITKSAYWSAIISLILIFLYILIRFIKWQYSVGAIISLIHDTLIVICMFSLLKGLVPFSLEIDQNFVAAILTIIGYSINDTVIVFDRIREFLSKNKNLRREAVINDAINNTFSRTIFTSFTVLLVVVVLFIFGGTALKSFAFAMTIGVLFGSYSSIFIATPIMLDLSNDDLSGIVKNTPA
ncbi:MAG: hypothetical protein RLZZ546_277, partial [Bacteroidota bacterium]